MKTSTKRFFRHHSLSLVSGSVLACWVVLYWNSNPGTHWGSFFGNAIADWTGLLVVVLATKYMYEIGSAESKNPPANVTSRMKRVLVRHSLSIFLIATGIAWVVLYTYLSPTAKWGQVVSNIVSEWTQIFGLVILTKSLKESHSKESKR